MKTNIDQNNDTKQPKNKQIGIMGGLGLLTGFLIIMFILFYGIY